VYRKKAHDSSSNSTRTSSIRHENAHSICQQIDTGTKCICCPCYGHYVVPLQSGCSRVVCVYVCVCVVVVVSECCCSAKHAKLHSNAELKLTSTLVQTTVTATTTTSVYVYPRTLTVSLLYSLSFPLPSPFSLYICATLSAFVIVCVCVCVLQLWWRSAECLSISLNRYTYLVLTTQEHALVTAKMMAAIASHMQRLKQTLLGKGSRGALINFQCLHLCKLVPAPLMIERKNSYSLPLRHSAPHCWSTLITKHSDCK
jgi:hypothetical protein